MKKLYLLTFLMMAFAVTAFAQDRTIKGTVMDADDSNASIPGVSVVVEGTTIGTITDIDGKYTLKVPAGYENLIFSYIGYESQTLPIGASTVVDVSMKAGLMMEEVVITALGISRKEKSLGYAVQDLEGDGFVQARESNIVNALNGKVAGVHINNSSGAVGASTRITLRGASSIQGNNQPLFVVDGIPIDNTNYGNAGSSGGFDQPNGIADVNPDDIETISVLKGPNAAALYGGRGANGVIIITTKKGKAGKKGLGISVNSTTTFEKPLVIPTFQNSYGQGGNQDFFEFIDGSNGDGGVDESWGPPLDVGLEFVQWDSYANDGKPLPWTSTPDNIKDFYDTGITTNNNVSLSGGAENIGYRLSLGHMNQKGIVPNTEFKKYNIGANTNFKIANKLSAGVSVNYIKSGSDNLPTGGYNNENPVQQMIWSGRQVDFDKLRDYENLPLSDPNTAAGGTPLNWNTLFQNNAFWVQDNNLNQLDKDRVIGNVELGYDINDMFNIRVKTGADTWASTTKERKAHGSNENPEGYYREISRKYTEINSEAMLGFNKAINDDFQLSLNFGGNVMTREYKRLLGEAPQLELPGVYALSNVKSGVSTVLTNTLTESRINSLLGFGQLAYKDAIYLDFSARNDWASVLPTENNSFFYPSVSLSAVITDLLDMNSSTLSFLKVRGGWSKVGSIGALDAYSLEQPFNFRDDAWGNVLLPYNPDVLNNPNLIAETTTGVEFGVDARLFKNRIRVDATYYIQNSTDLIVDAEVSAASGFVSTKDNVGEIENKGIELQLGATLIKSRDLTVDLGVIFSKNNNVVKSLGGDLEALILGGQWDVDIQARTGLPYGVLVGHAFQKDDQGRIVHLNGLPQIDTEVQILGDIQPDWTGGLTLDLNYKGITVGTIIDAKIGGEIYSMTNAWGRYAGVLNETVFGRETGVKGDGSMVVGADGDGNPIYAENNVVVRAETYNKRAYSNSVSESSVFDASYVKLRQILIGYDLPSSLFKGNVFQKASISLVGRNLAILHRNAPHIDPESAFSSDNGEQGQEFGQLPSTRSIGVNLNLKF